MNAAFLTEEQIMTDATTEATARVTRAKLALLMGKATDNPADGMFFAALLMKQIFVCSDAIDTAGVNGTHLIYNPEFIMTLTPAETIGILVHEMMHLTNKHHLRRLDRDRKIWNWAADLAINPLILAAGYTMPADLLFPGFAPFEFFPLNLSAEGYYALIVKEQDAGKDFKDADKKQLGDVSEPSENMTQAELAAADLETTAQVCSAKAAAGRRGTMSGGVDETTKLATKPIVSWKAQLREYMTANAKNRIDWNRPNRRHAHRGFYLPTRSGKELGHVVCLVDTSGSVRDAIPQFLAEIQDIGQQAEKITIMLHNCDCYAQTEWTPADGPMIIPQIKRGGTDHIPSFGIIDAMPDEPTLVVCLTDLESTFPTQPNYPVLWVSINARYPHPWGDRINID